MDIFDEHVRPRIARLEGALELIPRKMNYALERDDYDLVTKYAEDALEYEHKLRALRALEGAPDGDILLYLGQS